MRLGIIAAGFLAVVACAGIARAGDPEVLLVPGLGGPEEIEANPDGRAWLRGAKGTNRAHVVGPGDNVERLADANPLSAPWPPEVEPRADALTLGKDGTIEQKDGAAPPLPQSFLRQLGSKPFRRALAYDAKRDQYVLLRSRRPAAVGTATDLRWSIVFFKGERVLEEVVLPEVPQGGASPIAAADGVVWVGFSLGVLRWQNGEWTEFADQDKLHAWQEAEREERNDLVTAAASFTLGNAALASAFSVPVSLGGNQRFVPTAVTSFAGALPATATAALLAAAGSGNNTQIGRALSGVAVFLGVLTLPLVALTTYATGEVGFRGTNEGAYLGALGGSAAGALVWTAAVSAVSTDATLKKGWWWLLPIGGAFIGTASTTGYLWAGQGFTHY